MNSARIVRRYREFIVDLEKCVMLESTFMEQWRSALRLKELGQGHLRVVHCGPRITNCFRLGLDQLSASRRMVPPRRSAIVHGKI